MTTFAHLPPEARFAAEWLANELECVRKTGDNGRALTLSPNHAAAILEALKAPKDGAK